MPKRFWYSFLYWAKTGKRSLGYLLSQRDYHHAFDCYHRKQVLRTEQDEMNSQED